MVFARTIKALPPLPVTDPMERMLDLMPVPAVVVARHGGRLVLEQPNAAFRGAGLGAVEGRSDAMETLRQKLGEFLDSDVMHTDFPWSVGELIDLRHYGVNLVRPELPPCDRCVMTLIDQTSQRHTERSLRREMTTDSLTGLPNREGFGTVIEEVHGDRARHALLVVDLARFGRLNACLGSLVGDELLITVARRIKGALRSCDLLARIGGDEFGILMTIDEERVEAHHLAGRIQRALSSPFRLTDYEIGVECSIGIAYGADEGDDAEEMIRHAQFAVKRAKESGQSESYQPDAFVIARKQFGMETSLRRAIENRALRLTYQPICNLATGAIVSFEALARWTDDDGIDHAPSDFIPVAEESGLIVPLGRWAIDEAARTLAAWDIMAGGDCGMRLAVNLSAIQLQRDAIAPVVERALTAHGLHGERFTLELTESAIVTDPDRVTRTMQALKALGATLAMDDFGTGYSNLAYLQKLPIDILKIDRSFVTGMLADRDKIAIVRAVLSLSRALGMQTTAEGIETVELGQTLAALGCTYGQGYIYARPLEADAAYAFACASSAATTSSAI
ncbi:putative bifunctional diguanylate cyclase/phosphodiesterase [uncultured Sphingomonas sp.]|uniref:putative bifunctional diguanylate cyclase/phosphodiesterase n=1 Tax=uncultured Sphingomonas sp. TaxID=158754 RepID=UPI0035CA7B7C